MKISKTVNEAVRDLYAVMASTAAARAVRMVNLGEHTNADICATRCALWLEKAGARATGWKFRLPQVPQ